jgi:hypothetical protein
MDTAHSACDTNSSGSVSATLRVAATIVIPAAAAAFSQQCIRPTARAAAQRLSTSTARTPHWLGKRDRAYVRAYTGGAASSNVSITSVTIIVVAVTLAFAAALVFHAAAPWGH